MYAEEEEEFLVAVLLETISVVIPFCMRFGQPSVSTVQFNDPFDDVKITRFMRQYFRFSTEKKLNKNQPSQVRAIQ